MPTLSADNDATNEALLIHEIARQIRTCFDRRAQFLGFTRSQWYALALIRRNPGVRQAALADLMEIEPITLGRLLDRMEKSGWIMRKIDATDRRAKTLHLTPKVKNTIAEMQTVALGVRLDALNGFSDAEHEQLVSYLSRIKTNVTAMLQEQ